MSEEDGAVSSPGGVVVETRSDACDGASTTSACTRGENEREKTRIATISFARCVYIEEKLWTGRRLGFEAIELILVIGVRRFDAVLVFLVGDLAKRRIVEVENDIRRGCRSGFLL